jgi:hypothetical protein
VSPRTAVEVAARLGSGWRIQTVEVSTDGGHLAPGKLGEDLGAFVPALERRLRRQARTHGQGDQRLGGGQLVSPIFNPPAINAVQKI